MLIFGLCGCCVPAWREADAFCVYVCAFAPDWGGQGYSDNGWLKGAEGYLGENSYFTF